jgi:hypothetical protein
LKTCVICKISQDEQYFRRWAVNKDGLKNSCRFCQAAQEKIYAEKLRAACFKAYGGAKCAKCGTEDLGAIFHIDHIDGGGNEQRRALYSGWNSGGRRFWGWLKRQGWPPGYRVLCMKCNCYHKPLPKAVQQELGETNEKV